MDVTHIDTMLWELAASQYGWTPMQCDELTDEEFAAVLARLVERKMAEVAAIKSATAKRGGSDTLPESIALAQMGITPVAAGA